MSHRPAEESRSSLPGAAPRDGLGDPSRAAAALAFLGSLLLLVWHPDGQPMWHTLWAEDGQIFLTCQDKHGVLSCLTTAYGGYLHAGPRLLITLVPLFPVSSWPVVTSSIALVFDALALASVFSTTRWLIPSVALRGLTLAVVAVSAAAHWEAAGNLTNLHWFLLVSGIFVAVNPDSSGAAVPTAIRGLWLALACGSEALAPIIVLAYVVGLVLRRRARGRFERPDAAVGVVAAVVALTQVLVQLGHPRPTRLLPEPGLSDIWRDYRRWVVQYSWHGLEGSSSTVRLCVLVVALALAAVGVLVRIVERSWDGGLQVAAGTLLVLGSVGEFGVSEYVNRSVSPRYIFAPFALALFGVVTVLSTTGRVLTGRPARVRVATSGALALGLSTLVVALAVLGPYPPRAAVQGLLWKTEITEARAACHAHGLTRTRVIVAPYSPRAAYFFYAPVPCDRI